MIEKVLEVKPRSCHVNLSAYWCKQLGIGTDGALLSATHHGFFQTTEASDCSYPTAVVELTDGRVVVVAAECIIFR